MFLPRFQKIYFKLNSNLVVWNIKAVKKVLLMYKMGLYILWKIVLIHVQILNRVLSTFSDVFIDIKLSCQYQSI